MINVKPQVYNALLTACPTANVSDEFPKEWKSFPKVTYTEEQNEVITWTDNEEKDARLVYRIDVWDKTSTSATAMAIDGAMSSLGFIRTMSMDVPVQELYKHKQMRYECVISVDTEDVFHE